MARTIGIGIQDFEKIRKQDLFYIDKTMFIKEWWESMDDVTLITRPRRFGKTLSMNMLEKFFSVDYDGRDDLFKGLDIWQYEAYRELQGTWPVIFLSFANVKETSYLQTKKKICQVIEEAYNKYDFLLEGNLLNEKERAYYHAVKADMEEYIATSSIRTLADYLSKYYGKKVIILLDEYDTPMQEAYIHGYWDELAGFTRSLFNSAFKTNPYMERAIMTGITRVSRESVFSDLNNLTVITTTTDYYSDSFGFTQEEVESALKEYGLSEQKEMVRQWYDGFTFGNRKNIYNPWSILNFLKRREYAAYWAPEAMGLRVAGSRQMSASSHSARCFRENTSNNALIANLIQRASSDIKGTMEDLLKGQTFHAKIDEQIVFNQLDQNESAIWSLLLASGYLRVESCTLNEMRGREEFELALTNREVYIMFERMIQDWFSACQPAYNEFIKALLKSDVKAMNVYMNKVALETFSYFDTGRRPSEDMEPERFYHGFVLGLMVELSDRYVISSNRESGFGRYDVLLEPRKVQDRAIIMEFKVQEVDEEKELSDTVRAALLQIEEKKYSAALNTRGICSSNIDKYGFAFCGKKVLIDKARALTNERP